LSAKKTVIILRGDPSSAASLAACFPGEEFETAVPQSSDEFYRVVNTLSVDLVVIDNQLPGFLSGIEILERLQKDLLRPAALLIAVNNIGLDERIRGLQSVAIVKPSAGVEEIAEKARTAIKSGSVAQVAIKPEARWLVQKADVIRPMPQILVKYAGKLQDESCSLADLAQDISVDPKMTSVLLKIMNSAAMAVRGRTTRVSDAVNFLGVRRTVSLILSANLTQSQSTLAMSLPDGLRAWYHNRSVLIAGAAAAFARHAPEASPDTAYVLGLLQELGIPILAHTYGDRYLDLIRRTREIGQLRLEVAEQQELDLTHADVSGAVLQKWGMPQSLIRLVANHHQSDPAVEMPHSERVFLQLMHIGEALANLSDNRSPQRHQSLTQALALLGPLSAEQVRECLAEAVARALESAKLLSIPIPDETKLREMVGQLAEPEALKMQLAET
jgi:HD-like signal output (HDOD) protein